MKRRCQVRYVVVDPKVPIVRLFALWIDFSTATTVSSKRYIEKEAERCPRSGPKNQGVAIGALPICFSIPRLALNTIYGSLESLAYFNLMKRIFE